MAHLWRWVGANGLALLVGFVANSVYLGVGLPFGLLTGLALVWLLRTRPAV